MKERAKKKSLTEEEKKLLFEFFEHSPKKVILSKFPDRSGPSIFQFAKKLGLKRDPEIISQDLRPIREDTWSPQEIQIVKDHYESILQKDLEGMLPGRTFRAIREMGLRLGLTRNKDIVDKDREIKNKKTLMDRYGVDCSLKIPEAKAKSLQTNLDRRGVPYHNQTQEGQNKIKKTVQERYGVDNVFQVSSIQDLAKQSLYKNGTQRCSKQQAHIAALLHGEINYPIGNCNVDILMDDKIVCEYDGGGHCLQVKLGQVTQEAFASTERKRDLFLKSRGYLVIKIISKDDFLPSDEILLKMIEEGKQYLKSGHSWIEFNIDKKQIRCSKKQENYDFGTLRKIYKKGEENE